MRIPEKLRRMRLHWRERRTIAASRLFDTSWYLAQNPDVAAAGVNPLAHYVRTGAAEGRDPHPLVDLSAYLEQHPETKAASLSWRVLNDPELRRRVMEAARRVDNAAAHGVWPSKYAHNCAPLNVARTAPSVPTFNILVPTVRPAHIFGGIATAVKLGLHLAARGHAVRFVSSDSPLARGDEAAFLDFLRTNWAATDEQLVRVGVLAGDYGDRVTSLGSDDWFVATAWWTAHKARATIERYGFTNRRFIYLIQDYEPGFYAWSTDYALAAQSYGFVCLPIVNTTLLAEYLRLRTPVEIDDGLVLRPEIDWSRYAPPSAEEIAARTRRRIFVYGRPSVDRNLFGVIVAALREWLSRTGLTSADVEVVSAGEAHGEIPLANDIRLRSIGMLSRAAYATELRASDIGVSLMLSPHPSYPPFEMAASGLIAITNCFENKNLNFSSNIVSVEPTPTGVAEALAGAWSRVGEAESRHRGSAFDLSFLGRPMEEVVDRLLERVARERAARGNLEPAA